MRPDIMLALAGYLRKPVLGVRFRRLSEPKSLLRGSSGTAGKGEATERESPV
jgi:hypothetical protein